MNTDGAFRLTAFLSVFYQIEDELLSVSADFFLFFERFPNLHPVNHKRLFLTENASSPDGVSPTGEPFQHKEAQMK